MTLGLLFVNGRSRIASVCLNLVEAVRKSRVCGFACDPRRSVDRHQPATITKTKVQRMLPVAVNPRPIDAAVLPLHSQRKLRNDLKHARMAFANTR